MMRLIRWLMTAALAVSPVLAAVPAFAEAEVTADNRSQDTEAKSGSANAQNSSADFVGHNASEDDTTVSSQDIDNAQAGNIQEGDNSVRIVQESNVSTGDAVAGQVIGAVVQDGDLTINASNVSEDVSIETGDATGTNQVAAFVGLNLSGDGTAVVADISDAVAANIQEGDNDARIDQTVNAASGDGVGGQVIGAVVNGGSTDITASNRSEDVDIQTGDVDGENALAAFVGLNTSAATSTVAVADITQVQGVNVQEGDNDFRGSQASNLASGDGVAGQILGVVSSGDTTINASNISRDVSVETGDATSFNHGAVFVGMATATTTVVASDITGVNAINLQEGDNQASLTQTADVVTGDAVAGQVAGVVTTAGGTTDAVLSNVSEDADVTSGEGTFTNLNAIFTGLQFAESTVVGQAEGADVVGSIFTFAIS